MFRKLSGWKKNKIKWNNFWCDSCDTIPREAWPYKARHHRRLRAGQLQPASPFSMDTRDPSQHGLDFENCVFTGRKSGIRNLITLSCTEILTSKYLWFSKSAIKKLNKKIVWRSSRMRCSNKSGDPERKCYKSSSQEVAVEQPTVARWLTSGPQDSKIPCKNTCGLGNQWPRKWSVSKFHYCGLFYTLIGKKWPNNLYS